jgi:hypothetical protein
MVSIPADRDQTLPDDLLSCAGGEINFDTGEASKLTSNVAGPASSPSIHETRNS